MFARASLLCLNIHNRLWAKKFPNNMVKGIKLKAAVGLVHLPQQNMSVDNNYLFRQY